jgi:hypothetical protein
LFALFSIIGIWHNRHEGIEVWALGTAGFAFIFLVMPIAFLDTTEEQVVPRSLIVVSRVYMLTVGGVLLAGLLWGIVIKGDFSTLLYAAAWLVWAVMIFAVVVFPVWVITRAVAVFMRRRHGV